MEGLKPQLNNMNNDTDVESGLMDNDTDVESGLKSSIRHRGGWGRKEEEPPPPPPPPPEPIEEPEEGGSESEGDDELFRTSVVEELPKPKKKRILRYVKLTILTIVWAVSTWILMRNAEIEMVSILITVPPKIGKSLKIQLEFGRISDYVGLVIRGPCNKAGFSDLARFRVATNDDKSVNIKIRYSKFANNKLEEPKSISDTWNIVFQAKDYQTASLNTLYHKFSLELPDDIDSEKDLFEFHFEPSQSETQKVPLHVSYDAYLISPAVSILVGIVLLSIMYILIIFHVVHRALASVIACTFGLAALAYYHSRPKLDEILRWISLNDMMLLFGMLMIAALLSTSGIIEYLAVTAYRLSNGHIWPLLNCLFLICTLLAFFLEHTVVAILVTPITIKICEIMQLNPSLIIAPLVLFTNIASAVVPIPSGDSGSLYLADRFKVEYDLTSASYIMYMWPPITLAIILSYLYFRILFVNSSKMRFSEPELERLQRVIRVWKHTAKTVGVYSREEKTVRRNLMHKVHNMRSRVRRLGKMPTYARDYKETLEYFEQEYVITNKVLVIKCSIVLIVITIMCMLVPFRNILHLSMGWISVLGAMVLLILADLHELDEVITRIEWSTLLFVATNFITCECLSRIGFIGTICEGVKDIIIFTPDKYRMYIGIFLIMSTSMFLSALTLNSTPITLNVMETITRLRNDPTVSIKPLPLILAMALGIIFGNNGTLVSAIPNIVTAGIIDRHGYRYRFWTFFKIGFPLMFCNIILATLYLFISRIWME